MLNDDAVAQYARAVAKRDKKIEKMEKAAEEWPENCKHVVALIKRSVKDNPDIKRIVDGVDKTDAYLWDILSTLKEKCSLDTDDERTESLLALVNCLHASGDTAETTAEKFRAVFARAEKAHGATVDLESLARVLFPANVGLFPSFSSVAESLANLPKDAKLELCLKTFTNAKKKDGSLVIDEEEMGLAIGKLVARAFKNVKAPAKAGGRPNKWQRGKQNLGGGTSNEGVAPGVLAYMTQTQVQSYEKGKGKGKGGNGGGAWGACFNCGDPNHKNASCPHPPTSTRN